MIDRERRDTGIKILEKVLQEEIDAESFGDNFPVDWSAQLPNQDAALKAVYDAVFVRLSNRPERHASESSLVERCVLFLTTDRLYEWEEPFYLNTFDFPQLTVFLTLGLAGLINRIQLEQDKLHFEQLRRSGDVEVYPFLRKQDFDGATAQFQKFET